MITRYGKCLDHISFSRNKHDVCRNASQDVVVVSPNQTGIMEILPQRLDHFNRLYYIVLSSSKYQEKLDNYTVRESLKLF